MRTDVLVKRIATIGIAAGFSSILMFGPAAGTAMSAPASADLAPVADASVLPPATDGVNFLFDILNQALKNIGPIAAPAPPPDGGSSVGPGGSSNSNFLSFNT